MFTGIVEEVGHVRSVGPGRLVINAKRVTWGTNLGDLKVGDPVNLERALTLAGRIGGHLVRGVIEYTGTLASLTPQEHSVVARFFAPREILRYTIVKGSIAVNGASLTIIDRDDESFSVGLIPFTQEHTNLLSLAPGDRVNLESDIIARYVEQLLDERYMEGIPASGERSQA